MTEQEEREQLKTKIIDDIEFLKSKEIDIRTLLRSYFSDIKELYPVDKALNTVKMNSINYLDTGTIDTLHTFYTSFINRFTIAARAFLNNSSSKNTQTEIIESAKEFNEFANSINIKNKSEDTNFVLKADGGAGLSLEFNKIYQRIKTLEQEQKPLNEIVIAYSNEINVIKEKITDLQSSNTQIEITKILAQTKTLFDEAKDSEQLVNDEVQKLIKATEREVAYTLSKQFSEKTDSLKRPIWSYLILIILLPIYMSYESIGFIELLLKPASNEIYWHTIFMLLLTKLPIIFLILFVLNEYTKAKKLFEEYEHKRIMAATLVNNLERLKNELHADEKDLLELIKTPFEKIFDNPVHSIYGDKSGDKNIGLDQLEKITSIIEKMKSK